MTEHHDFVNECMKKARIQERQAIIKEVEQLLENQRGVSGISNYEFYQGSINALEYILTRLTSEAEEGGAR